MTKTTQDPRPKEAQDPIPIPKTQVTPEGPVPGGGRQPTPPPLAPLIAQLVFGHWL
jgi:hypothetical protein